MVCLVRASGAGFFSDHKHANHDHDHDPDYDHDHDPDPDHDHDHDPSIHVKTNDPATNHNL